MGLACEGSLGLVHRLAARLNPDSGPCKAKPKPEASPHCQRLNCRGIGCGANEETKQGDGAQKCKLARTLQNQNFWKANVPIDVKRKIEA